MRTRRLVPASASVTAARFAYGNGTTLPSTSNGAPASDPRTEASSISANFQEARLERDAWKGIAESLAKLQALQSNVAPRNPTGAMGEGTDDG